MRSAGAVLTSMPDPRAFSDVYVWIRAAITARGDSVSGASLGAGLSKNAVAEILKHRAIPEGPTLDKLAVYFHADPAELRDTFGLNEQSWEARFHRERSGEWRTCPAPGCPRHGERKWVVSTKLAGWRACSTACANALRRRFVAWNPLQEQCDAYMAEHGLSLTAFAAVVGLPDIQLRRWYRNKDSSIPQSSRTKIAKTIDIAVDQRMMDAVPVHADDRVNELRRAHAKQWFAGLTPEQRKAFARLGAAGRRGYKEPDEAKKRRIKRMLASTKGRVVWSLNGFLMRHPSASPEELGRWRVNTSRRLRQQPSFVYGVVRPHLKKRGLHLKLGRPPVDQRRRDEIERLMMDWPRDRRGALVNGFWTEALRWIRKFEGNNAPTTKESLRQWWLDQAVTHA